jgi:hypothetical protein
MGQIIFGYRDEPALVPGKSFSSQIFRITFLIPGREELLPIKYSVADKITGSCLAHRRAF